MKRILVIDDDASIRQAIRITLAAQGHTILESVDGESGLAVARAEHPDLILSDVNMQGMSGFCLLQRLRAQEKTSAIPVILMTGVPDRAPVRSGMEQGADDYLIKPFRCSELVAAVKARLERQDLLQASAKANEARLLALLSATNDLIALAHPQGGNLLYLNAAGRKMLQTGSEDEVRQLRLNDFLSDTPAMTLEKRLARAREEGTWVGESEILARDGSRVSVSEQIMAHRLDGKEISYFSIVSRDITERKRAELELQETHGHLIEASRRAGMAEVATGVLHNVGNVLNSINVASACLADSLRRSNTHKISKIAALFKEHSSDLGAFLSSDPKGLQIPAYLSQLGDRLAQEQETLRRELAQLQKGVEHIRSIVATQQSLARAGGRHENVKISEVIDEALCISSVSGAARGVEIVREIDDEVCLTTDKHLVLQILLNLLGNAKQACEAVDGREKRVTIRATRFEGNVRIAVRDTGIGIPFENLERIFEHGFTTKRNGHGFGLYSSSRAAKELEGSLKVESQGLGKGATFTLELPKSPNT